IEEVTWSRNKGGRPRMATKKDCFIGVRFTLDEKKLIREKAKERNQGAGEYLRNLGLNRQIDIQTKALPKEVLLMIGTLNHLSANINQLAKKRNQEQNFSLLEIARLTILAAEVKELASSIKSYVK